MTERDQTGPEEDCIRAIALIDGDAFSAEVLWDDRYPAEMNHERAVYRLLRHPLRHHPQVTHDLYMEWPRVVDSQGRYVFTAPLLAKSPRKALIKTRADPDDPECFIATADVAGEAVSFRRTWLKRYSEEEMHELVLSGLTHPQLEFNSPKQLGFVPTADGSRLYVASVKPAQRRPATQRAPEQSSPAGRLFWGLVLVLVPTGLCVLFTGPLGLLVFAANAFLVWLMWPSGGGGGNGPGTGGGAGFHGSKDWADYPG